MDIQTFIFEHYRPLLLIAGLLFLFLGIMPIISRDYYYKNLESAWDKKIWPFSEHDGYIYGRYIRQIYPLLMGTSLICIAIYKFLHP